MTKASTKHPIRDILLKEIDRSRNYRIPDPSDKERITTMAMSIKTCGQLQPVRVYKRGPNQKDPKHQEPYILGFGDRRCSAQLLLDRKTIRAEVWPSATDAEIEQARAVENLHRADISPLEEVQAVANLLNALDGDETFDGDPYDEVAARLGVSVTWVRDRDYLHRLTAPVRAFVAKVGLPAGHLRELAKVGDEADQLRLACDCAGAPVWAFRPDTGSRVSTESTRAEFLASVADGRMQRWPLSKLKREVDLVKRSLKVVPWEYATPVEHGKTKLRACKDCPHNSETDQTLFGLESEEQNPRGYCLNASCFEEKRKLADAAKKSVLQKVAKRQDQSPAVIRRAAPRWLKDSTVVGFVQRELKKAAETPKSVEQLAESAKPASSGRKMTPHEEALIIFRNKQIKWQTEAFQAILAAINASPAYRVGWCLLAGTEVFQEQENWRLPHINSHASEPCTEEPTLPELNPKVVEAIDLAMKGTRAAWIELADWTEQDDPDSWPEIGWIHPDALVALAKAMSVTLPERVVWQGIAESTTA